MRGRRDKDQKLIEVLCTLEKEAPKECMQCRLHQVEIEELKMQIDELKASKATILQGAEDTEALTLSYSAFRDMSNSAAPGSP